MKMHNTEVSSLINLLDDSDSEVVEAIMDRLCAKGEAALPMLESAWHNTFEEPQLARIGHVIAQIQKSTALAKLTEWLQAGAPDTLTGAYYVTKLFRPNIDFDRIKEQVAKLCREVRAKAHSHLTAPEQMHTMNLVLYDTHKFVGKQLVDSDRLLLFSDLLQHKEGCQIALGLLYCCIAEGLHMPVTGISLSKSAMLGYVDHYQSGGKDMLFYIDPCNGAFFGKQQMLQAITKYIAPEKAPGTYLTPCKPRDYVLRYATVLRDLYREADKMEQSEKAEQVIQILGKNSLS